MRLEHLHQLDVGFAVTLEKHRLFVFDLNEPKDAAPHPGVSRLRVSHELIVTLPSDVIKDEL